MYMYKSWSNRRDGCWSESKWEPSRADDTNDALRCWWMCLSGGMDECKGEEKRRERTSSIRLAYTSTRADVAWRGLNWTELNWTAGTQRCANAGPNNTFSTQIHVSAVQLINDRHDCNILYTSTSYTVLDVCMWVVPGIREGWRSAPTSSLKRGSKIFERCIETTE